MKWLGTGEPNSDIRKNEDTKPNASFMTKFDLASCFIKSTIAARFWLSVFDMTSIIKSRTDLSLSRAKQVFGATQPDLPSTSSMTGYASTRLLPISIWQGTGDSEHGLRSKFASVTGLLNSAVISSAGIVDELTCSTYLLRTI